MNPLRVTLEKGKAIAVIFLMSISISGCEPLSLTLVSVGASVGLSHTLSGIVYKTFTAPMKKVEEGSVVAMKDMGVKVVSRATNKEGERIITAAAKDREIEVLLEPLAPRTTRVRVIASNGLLKDSATATEILSQTERVLSKG